MTRASLVLASVAFVASVAADGSCYDTTTHVVTCGVAEADCTGSPFAAGYIYNGCCMCEEGCDHSQETGSDCTYYDAALGSCYDSSTHVVTCGVAEADCTGYAYAAGYMYNGCCMCEEGCDHSQETGSSCTYYDSDPPGGACYANHEITCDMQEADCDGTYYEPGYVSSMGGCCLCAEGCDHSAETGVGCEYYDDFSAGSCYHNHEVTCNVAEAACEGSWYDPGYVSGYSGCCHCSASCDHSVETGTSCEYADSDVSPPPSPPKPPPTPPGNPPSPPQDCIPANGHTCSGDEVCGGAALEVPANPADPVNEPCYTHSSCVNGYVCCVAVGTCDSGYVSTYPKYYEGGCVGMNYNNDESDIASTSTSDAFPATVEGCVKQGECALPFIELVYGATGTGGGLTVNSVSDDVMDRLLTGAVEQYVGACRAHYPRSAIPAADVAFHASLSVTIEAELADLTATVLLGMEEKVALNVGVAKENVDIVPRSSRRRMLQDGGVILDIVIGYEAEADAIAAASALATVMADADDASAMLTTPALTVVAIEVAVPTSGEGAAPSPSSESDGLSTGAIVGIAVGASAGILLLIVAVMMLSKKKTVSPVNPKG